MTRILQLSDLHALAPEQRMGGEIDTARLLSQSVDELLDALERLAPVDALLVSGDISDDGSPASYALALEQLQRLALPMMVLPGNHDRREALRAVFRDSCGLPANGPLDWVRDVGELRVIGLDSLVEGEGWGRLAPASLDLLDAALAQSERRPVLLALHHPPFSTGLQFMDAIGLRDCERLAAVLAAHDGPLRVVCGHLHAAFYGEIGGHLACSSPSTSSGFAFDCRDRAPIGFQRGPRGFMFHRWDGGFLSATCPLPAERAVFPFTAPGAGR